jgi:hypothetical protein
MPAVKDGDCMVSLADSLGMQDYHTLYDDGVNSALKAKRPNPNQLNIGDDVKDPPGKGKVYKKAVDQTWTFVVKPKKPPKLRMVIVDSDGQPQAGKDWKLTAPKALNGKTKKDGLIEIPDFDPQEKNGTLEVKWQKTKAKKAAKPPKEKEIKTPTYPRPIKSDEFKDDQPAAPTAADDVIQFTLKIGSMPPFNEDAGTRARLHNLGFPCTRSSGADTTKKSVQAFQRSRLKQKTPSGVVADIRNDARDKHDNP